MTIAIDFDSTYTADSELWDCFIALARQRGHKVICVTCRRDTEENRAEVVIPGVRVVFTGLASKLWTMEHRGEKVDVWIDDDPRAAVNGR